VPYWRLHYHLVWATYGRETLISEAAEQMIRRSFDLTCGDMGLLCHAVGLMPDHVHMLISIPPKYSVAQIIGYMKGKSSIWIAQNVERKMRNFLGHKFWARGYFVTTVGRDEETIRAYIRNQEMADQQLDQFELKISAAPKSNQSS